MKYSTKVSKKIAEAQGIRTSTSKNAKQNEGNGPQNVCKGLNAVCT